MDVRLLRAFLAVAEVGAIGVAAQRLMISQPALTKQLQSLERQVGGTLFRRGRHGAGLTEFGHALLPEARDLVLRADAFSRRAERLARGELGRLAIGFGLSSIEFAPRVVAAFRRRYPEVEVRLDDLPSTVQRERLRDDRLQVGFVRLDASVPSPYRIVGTDRLAIAIGPDADPPDRSEPRDWLAGRPLVGLTPDRGPGLAGQIERLGLGWSLGLSVIQEADDLQTVLALVAAGVGAALVPASGRGIAPDGVRLFPIMDPAAAWRVAVLWRPDHAPALRFVELINDEGRSRTPGRPAEP